MANAIAVDQHCDHADPERVHQHGQGRCHQEQHRLVPEGTLVEDTEEIGEAEDREEVAQAGTGLGHLQLVDAQVDHIAFQEDGTPISSTNQTPISDETSCRKMVSFQNTNWGRGNMKIRCSTGSWWRRPRSQPHHGQHHAADPDDESIGHEIGDLNQIAEEPEEKCETRSPLCQASVSRRGPRLLSARVRDPAAAPAGTGRARWQE